MEFSNDALRQPTDVRWHILHDNERYAPSFFQVTEQDRKSYDPAQQTPFSQFLTALSATTLILKHAPLLEPAFNERAYTTSNAQDELGALLTSLPVGQALIHYGADGRTVDAHIQLRRAPTRKEVDQSVLKSVLDYAHEHYTRRREEVEAEILARWKIDPPGGPAAPSAPRPDDSPPPPPQARRMKRVRLDAE
jgi:hypothetical protein